MRPGRSALAGWAEMLGQRVEHRVALGGVPAAEALDVPGVNAAAHRGQQEVLAEVRRAEIVIALLQDHRLDQVARQQAVAGLKAR